jgi:hypothetical protein
VTQTQEEKQNFPQVPREKKRNTAVFSYNGPLLEESPANNHQLTEKPNKLLDSESYATIPPPQIHSRPSPHLPRPSPATTQDPASYSRIPAISPAANTDASAKTSEIVYRAAPSRFLRFSASRPRSWRPRRA